MRTFMQTINKNVDMEEINKTVTDIKKGGIRLSREELMSRHEQQLKKFKSLQETIAENENAG